MNLKISTDGLSWIELRRKYKKEHTSWTAMRTRCHNPKSQFYHIYGGRGIAILDGWNLPGRAGFSRFLEDMGCRPEGYTLERKDRDGPYSKDNCVWASGSEQCFNRSLLPGNKSGVAGLFWVERIQSWQVSITRDGQLFIFGYTASLFEAACIRRAWELRLYPRQFGLLETPVTLTRGMVDIYRYHLTHGLSCTDILTILTEFQEGSKEFGIAPLARRFGVGRALVRSLVRGKVSQEDAVSLCLVMNVDLRTLRKAKINGKLYEFEE